MISKLDALRFLTELALLAAAAVAGAAIAWPFGVVAPVIVAGIWGALIAPKSQRRLDDPSRLVIEIALFCAVAAGLAATGRILAAVALAVSSVTVAVALRRRQATGTSGGNAAG